jgi:hypothetical protein
VADGSGSGRRGLNAESQKKLKRNKKIKTNVGLNFRKMYML